jgi:hypothetical protein
MKLNITLIFFCFLFTSFINCDKENSAWENAKSIGTIEEYNKYLNQYPKGKYSEKALTEIGKIFYSNAKYNEAIDFFTDYSQKNPSDSISIFTTKIAKVISEQDTFSSNYDIKCEGDLQPIEGVWGLCEPIKGNFKLDGLIDCKIEDIEFSADVSDWAYLYEDSLMNKIIGWGVVVTHGDVIISSEDSDSLIQNNLPYYAENVVEIEPFDYFDRYKRLKIDKSKEQRLIVPIVIYENFNICTKFYQIVMNRVGMGFPPGSFYGVSSSANDVKSGLPTTIELSDKQNTYRFLVSMYKTDPSNKEAGMRIDENGVKMGVNTHALMFSIINDSHIKGTLTLNPIGCDKEYDTIKGKTN